MANWRRVTLVGLAVLLILGGCAPRTEEPPRRPPDPIMPPEVHVPTEPDEDAPGVADDPAAEAGWGHLTARFVYDGAPPPRQKLSLTRDQEFCSKQHPLDESLVVNTENGGLANVVVWLQIERGAEPQIHESYEETLKVPQRLDNEWCRFVPNIALVRTNQTLVIGNKDPVGHNTKVDFLANPSFNETIPGGGSIQKTFSNPERLPAQVGCSIHPWMKSWLLVQDHPYFAATDEDGHIEIRNLAAGQWMFQAWHERAGYVSQVTQNGKAEDWKRGRFTVRIKPGDNDLGLIQLKPDLFK